MRSLISVGLLVALSLSLLPAITATQSGDPRTDAPNGIVPDGYALVQPDR